MNTHANLSRGILDTLAQSGTKNSMIMQGNGSDLNNSKALKGRAKRKLVTQTMALSLIDASKESGKGKLIKSYWNSYYCQSKVYTANGKLYGKYCKNRFCTLCLAIRKADIINRYLPIIQTWEQPYFVTLTIKTFSRHSTKYLTDAILRVFRRIVGKYRKQHQREKGIKLMGIKSLECNFNPKKKTYNPHLHIIVPNKQMADILRKEWLATWAKAKQYEFANSAGQKAKLIWNREKALIEIIKYGSKIFTEPDINKKEKGANNNNLYAAALNHIFDTMKGVRIFERFGFDLPKENCRERIPAKVVKDYGVWEFDIKQADWINNENDKKLSNYIPTKEIMDLLTNRIDIKLE